MASTPLLWLAGARKETRDLLRSLWPALDADGRRELSAAILAGPPDDLLATVADDERLQSRDRRVFDRISMLQELRDPPLTDELGIEFRRLSERYPEWRAVEGERGGFAMWMEARWGPDAQYGVAELRGMDDNALLDVLLAKDDELREGNLDSWRQLAAENPPRALAILEQFAAAPNIDRTDVWDSALRGLRDVSRDAVLRGRLLRTVGALPRAVFERPQMTMAVADFLEAATSTDAKSVEGSNNFWTLFDRVLNASAGQPESVADPEDGDWVLLAINTSLGRVATAFLNVLFSRDLKVGATIPNDLRGRLDNVVGRRSRAHRLARVIVASRTSYLFAVDPEWARAQLLPSFTWNEEAESVSAWQGYAWQPRIDPSLWDALKAAFLGLFTPQRLERVGRARSNLAQMLVLVATDPAFGGVPRDSARSALRAMPHDTLGDAAGWIASYLQQMGDSADLIWAERIGPWLERTWPRDAAVRSERVAEQLSLAAIATRERFPDALRIIAPHLTKTHPWYVLSKLSESRHPDEHPTAALSLIDSIARTDEWIGADPLEQLLTRVETALPEIANSNIYRKWQEKLRSDVL